MTTGRLIGNVLANDLKEKKNNNVLIEVYLFICLVSSDGVRGGERVKSGVLAIIL